MQTYYEQLSDLLTQTLISIDETPPDKRAGLIREARQIMATLEELQPTQIESVSTISLLKARRAKRENLKVI